MDGTYWDESHCYRFTADEIDELEAATRALHQLSLAAVEHIVTADRFEQLAIAPGFADRISASWKARDPALAGRALCRCPLTPRSRRARGRFQQVIHFLDPLEGSRYVRSFRCSCGRRL